MAKTWAIVCSAVICAFWVAGGQGAKKVRVVGIPLILAISLALIYKSWLVGLLVAILGQFYRVGYGNYSPEDDDHPSFLASMTHDRDGWWIRAIVGGLYGLVALPLFMLGFINLLVFGGYIVLNILVGYCVSRFRLPVYPADIAVGLGISSIFLATLG